MLTAGGRGLGLRLLGARRSQNVLHPLHTTSRESLAYLLSNSSSYNINSDGSGGDTSEVKHASSWETKLPRDPTCWPRVGHRQRQFVFPTHCNPVPERGGWTLPPHPGLLAFWAQFTDEAQFSKH